MLLIKAGMVKGDLRALDSINSDIFRIIAGSIIIFFSLHLIGILNFNFMNKDIRFFTDRYSNNMSFPLLVGAAFGFGWTPCIGPILGSILTLAALEENFNKSILLLLFYSLGLAIPFIISGILLNKFLLFSKSFRKNALMILSTNNLHVHDKYCQKSNLLVFLKDVEPQ